MPDRVHHEDDEVWGSDWKRLSIITDCQILEQIFSGSAEMNDFTMRPIFVRIGRSIAHLHLSKFTPRMDTGRYIDWRPRDCNPVADHLCNMAMDARKDEDWLDPQAMEEALVTGSCFQLFLDGGCRLGIGGAASWALYSVTVSCSGRQWKLVAWSSRWLQDCQNSFLCETIALENGLQSLTCHLRI